MIAWDRFVAIRKWIAYKVIVTKDLAISNRLVTNSAILYCDYGDLEWNMMILAVEIFIIVLSVLVMSTLALMIYFYVMVKLGVRKRKLSQIRQVSELVNEKLGHRVAITTALVTIALIPSFWALSQW